MRTVSGEELIEFIVKTRDEFMRDIKVDDEETQCDEIFGFDTLYYEIADWLEEDEGENPANERGQQNIMLSTMNEVLKELLMTEVLVVLMLIVCVSGYIGVKVFLEWLYEVEQEIHEQFTLPHEALSKVRTGCDDSL